MNEKLTDEEIYRRFIPFRFQIGKPFASPLKEKDENPSFCIFVSRDGRKLLWKDFSLDLSGNAWDFVKQLYNCDFQTALELAINDRLANPTVYSEGKREFASSNERPIYMYSVYPEFTPRALAYWRSYRITPQTLALYNVREVIEIKQNGKCIFRNNNQLAFVYACELGQKFYFPDGKYITRFLNNIPGDYLWGKESTLVSKHGFSLVVKSRKDEMVCHEMGIRTVGIQSENGIISDENVEFIKTLPNPFLLGDNDEPGIKWAKKNNSTHGLFYILMKSAKDPSDCAKLFGIQQSFNEICEAINLF